MLVERLVQVGPFAAHFHVRFIDPPPRRPRTAPLPAQPLLDLRRVLLNPPVDRGVIHTCAALAHHLFEITIANAIAAVSTHRPENNLAFKVTPLEL